MAFPIGEGNNTGEDEVWQPDSDFAGDPYSGRYSSTRQASYNQVADWAQDAWGISTRSEISGRINTLAEQWKSQNGRWPSATELFQWGNFQRSLTVYASGTPFLPPFLNVDGNLWANDPMYGPQLVDMSHPAFADTAAASEMGGVFGKIGRQPNDLIEMAAGVGQGQSLPGFQDLFARVPSTTSEELSQILIGIRPGGGYGGGGGGGGGGTARTDLVFDEGQLSEQARAYWRPMMIEDLDDAEGLVDRYIKEANSFWHTQGGRLDFQTFVVQEARKTPRYKNLYRKKPDFMSEAEYSGRYTQTVAGFGLSEGTTRREIESGMSSGAGLTGFTDRVARGRENQLNTQGTFSQKAANNLVQLGAIGRS